MLTRWSNIDRDFFGRSVAVFDELRRTMDAMSRDMDLSRRLPGGAGLLGPAAEVTWPRANLLDAGDELVLCAAVPGMSHEDLTITATGQVLTLTGQRQVRAPEGYSVHRRERGAVRFSRSFSLPTKVNQEQVSATVKDGMLTLRMAKAPESQPRQITVTASE